MNKSVQDQVYYTEKYMTLPTPIFNGKFYPPEMSLLDVAKDKLIRATDALGFPKEQQKEMLKLIEEIWGKYDNYTIGNSPYHSFGSAEGAPIEFQICWDPEGPSFRFGSDSFALDHSTENNASEFYNTTRKLSNYEGVNCESSLAMEDYFKNGGRFGIGGHVVQWRKGGKPSFKIYFLHQPDQGDENLENALKQLNAIEPWEAIKAHFKKLGFSRPMCGALSLDMKDPDKKSRVKMYIAHDGHTAQEIDEISTIAKNYIPRAFEKAIVSTTGKSRDWEHPPVTYFSFFPGESVPSASLIFIPLAANLENDAVAIERCNDFLELEGDQKNFVKGMKEVFKAFSHKPLEDSKTLNFLAYIPGKQFSLNIGPGIFDNLNLQNHDL